MVSRNDRNIDTGARDEPGFSRFPVRTASSMAGTAISMGSKYLERSVFIVRDHVWNEVLCEIIVRVILIYGISENRP